MNPSTTLKPAATLNKAGCRAKPKTPAEKAAERAIERDVPETITVTDAARRLGISRNSAYAAVAAGEIPALKIGSRYVIPLPMWTAFMAG